jgi:hypothetical protein
MHSSNAGATGLGTYRGVGRGMWLFGPDAVTVPTWTSKRYINDSTSFGYQLANRVSEKPMRAFEASARFQPFSGSAVGGLVSSQYGAFCGLGSLFVQFWAIDASSIDSIGQPNVGTANATQYTTPDHVDSTTGGARYLGSVAVGERVPVAYSLQANEFVLARAMWHGWAVGNTSGNYLGHLSVNLACEQQA